MIAQFIFISYDKSLAGVTLWAHKVQPNVKSNVVQNKYSDSRELPAVNVPWTQDSRASHFYNEYKQRASKDQ